MTVTLSTTIGDTVYIQPYQAQPFYIDVAKTEELTYENEVTEYPVESGGTITDNIRPKPIALSMQCVVTNTPIGQMVTTRGDGPSEPVTDAYAMLTKIRDDRQVVRVSTSLRAYDNMAVKRVSIPRGPGGGDFLEFSVEFMQVEFVNVDRTKRVAIPPARPPSNKGPLPTKPIPKNPGLLKVQIYQIPTSGAYVWYDNDFGFWRYGVQHAWINKPGYTIDRVIHGHDNTNSTAVWNVYRSRPFGVSQDNWINHRETDTQYSNERRAAFNAAKDPDGDYDEAMDPWSPFDDLAQANPQNSIFIVYADLVVPGN